jgi:hypothetical protein
VRIGVTAPGSPGRPRVRRGGLCAADPFLDASRTRTGDARLTGALTGSAAVRAQVVTDGRVIGLTLVAGPQVLVLSHDRLT